MSLTESLETSTGIGGAGAVPPAVRRAAMLEHPTLAVAAIQQGRIRQTNAPWSALFALPPDVSVESHVATLFPNATSADRFERTLQAELVAAGSAAAPVRLEHLLTRRDGSAFLAEIVVCPFGGARSEHPLGVDAIWQVRDITVERTLRRELRDLEEYHRELSRHQWDMTFVIDRKGRVAYASSSIEGALGYRVNAMLGEPFTTLLDPTHAPAAEQWLRAASRKPAGDDETTTGEGFPLRVLHSDGSVRVLACRPRDCFAVPRIAGMVVHARDITADVGSDDDAGAVAPESSTLRAALIELAHETAPTPHDRIDALLAGIRARVDASVVTFWPADDDGQPQPSRSSRADGTADEAPPPLTRAATTGSLAPRIVHDTRESTVSNLFAALPATTTGALVEVPVPGAGRTLGWLAVASAEPRRWTDAEVDFIVASGLLVALALNGRAPSPPVEADASGSARDALTGLPDRASIEAFLATRVAAGVGESLVVLGIDLDRLQDVNDGLGLAAGDAAIRRAATILLDAAGTEAFTGRIGGDEFVVVLEGLDPRQVDALVRVILDRMAEPDEGADGIAVPASIGVARGVADGGDASTLLSQADLAMRESKSRGGAQAFVFNPRLGATLRARKALDLEIEDALTRNEFTIFYQPQVALSSGQVVGLEALLRWNHPTRGLVLPDAFMGSAFKRGLIDAVTKLVLTQVCEQIAAWRRAGNLPELPVAVNITGPQFHERRLPAMVASALLKSGLPARMLLLEITERSLVGDTSGVERVVKELSRLGVRIAVGDFNVGHASFQALRQLDVAQIKLDRGFVKGLPTNAESAIFVAACVDLARRLKYQVVAEGVETRAQFEHLRAIGCNVGQGFYVGAPMSAVEIQSFIESNRKNPIH